MASGSSKLISRFAKIHYYIIIFNYFNGIPSINIQAKEWIKPLGKRKLAHQVLDPAGALAKTRCGIYVTKRFIQYASTEDTYCAHCFRKALVAVGV